jgi:small-conductance mechanosensitive channel
VHILITLAEIGLIIVAFVILNGLVNIGFRALKASPLNQRTEKLKTLQQNISVVLLITCVCLCLVVVVVNGGLIYQNKSVPEFYINLFQSIPQQFWVTLVVAIAKCLSLLLLVKLSLPYLNRLLSWGSRIAQNSDHITANDESIQVFFNSLKKILSTSIWILAFILGAQFLGFPAIVIKYLSIALKAYLAISVGRLIIKLISVLVDTLDALSLKFSSPDNVLRYYERFRHLVPAFKKALEYILYVAIATLVVNDIDYISWVANYSDEIVQIIGIYFLCGILTEIANIILEDLVLKTDHLTDLQRKRRLTVIPLFKSLLRYLIYFTGGVMVLNLLGINPAPILAGAGIVGIAIGFGAQNLINDIVCGFFILFENYYLVGDYIEAGKVEERVVEGVVEAIELRTTHIRHPDGQLQIVRNGEIGSVVNYSKEYTYAKVDVSVMPETTLEQVYAILEQVGQQLKDECADVLEPTLVEGLENFDTRKLTLRTVTRVKPGRHLYIQRLLRGKIKIAFDHHQIVMSEG